MAKRTLYDISADMEAFEELLIELEGDVSDPRVDAALQEWDAELERDFKGKLDNIAALVKEWDARARARRSEAARLSKLVAADENAIARLKGYAKFVLEKRGIDKVECKRFTLSVANNGGNPPVQFTGAVPDRWLIAQEPKIDTRGIIDALKAGDKLEFARFGERGTHLNIR